MSVFNDKLTQKGIIEGIKKIKQAFPVLEKSFYDILMDRISNNNFTDKQFLAAINHVIDTCVYPTPTIANFVTYTPKIKLYDYQGMIKLNNESNGMAFKFYSSVRIPDSSVILYASNQDIKKYNLELWNTK